MSISIETHYRTLWLSISERKLTFTLHTHVYNVLASAPPHFSNHQLPNPRPKILHNHIKPPIPHHSRNRNLTSLIIPRSTTTFLPPSPTSGPTSTNQILEYPTDSSVLNPLLFSRSYILTSQRGLRALHEIWTPSPTVVRARRSPRSPRYLSEELSSKYNTAGPRALEVFKLLLKARLRTKSRSETVVLYRGGVGA